MKLVEIPNVGWKLLLNPTDKKDIAVVSCLKCGEEVKDHGYLCPTKKRLLHQTCDTHWRQEFCRGSQKEHIHYNIVNIVWEKTGLDLKEDVTD